MGNDLGGGRACKSTLIGLFSEAPALCPLRDDTLCPLKPSARISRQSIAGTAFPPSVQPRQPAFQRAWSGAENVQALSAQNVANELSAMTCLPDNLPDGGPVVRQFQDRFVCFLPSSVAFVLHLLGIGEEFGIDVVAANRLPDLPHELADGVQKRSARILHEMPTIGNLPGFRQPFCNRLAISAAPVTGNNRYRRAFGKPGSRRLQRSVRQ